MCNCVQFHGAINAQETAHMDAVFIVHGDFNHCNLCTVLPKYHQHVHFPMTKEKDILEHVYSNVKSTYKAVPHRHSGQLDHISLLLDLAYT